MVIEDVVGTYELSSCYNVTIDCRAADMIATVRTNKIFNGKIYAKDNPNSCVVDVENAIEFEIKMGYNEIECNVKRKSQGVYTNEVIIQHHDSIVTALDLGLALNCQYDLSNRTILNDFDLVSMALIKVKKCFFHPIFGFWSFLTKKLRKYYVIFVYILQGKMGKTVKNRKKIM